MTPHRSSAVSPSGAPTGATWDAAIVGGGPAGLTAALMLGRYRRRTLLFDDDQPRNAVTKEINGIPVLEGLTARDFRERAVAHIARYPDVQLWNEQVVNARQDGPGLFVLETATGATERARCVLLATGVEDICPDDVAGFYQFYGTTIHHCPDCDGHEATGKRIAVVSWGNKAAPYALEFLNWTTEITILAHGHPDSMPAEHVARLTALGIRIDPRPLSRFEGRGDQLAAARFADGTTESFEAAYFYIGQRPRSDLARSSAARSRKRATSSRTGASVPACPECSPRATSLHRTKPSRLRWPRVRSRPS